MEIQSGYKTITPIQWANVLWALQSGLIGAHALRVYLACFVLVAIREAASRAPRRRRKPTRRIHRYRQSELERLTQLCAPDVRAALRELRAAGLASFGESEVVIATESLLGSEDLCEELSCRRSPKRPIPVPRNVLRFLARSRSTSLTLVVIAYLVRGLSIARRSGEICAKGTVKASWIARVFGLSPRAVKYAQAKLQELEWISKDTESHQCKLNRHGAYFAIDLGWKAPSESRGATMHALQPKADAAPATSPFVNRDKAAAEIAPPPPVPAPIFALPIENKETSKEIIQNPETHAAAEPARSGVFEKGMGSLGISGHLPAPSLDKIIPEDLWRLGRLESLYFQAVERGWFAASEARVLAFLAAAVHARDTGQHPPRLFAAIVRRQLWHTTTQAQEELARKALIRRRERNPHFFRNLIGQGEGCPDATARHAAA